MKIKPLQNKDMPNIFTTLLEHGPKGLDIASE